MTQIDGDLVKQLAGILNETGLTEIEYDTGSLKIRVAKSVHQTAVMAAPMPAMGHAVVAAAAAAAPSDAANHPGCIKSPMVGVAYLSPEPGKPPFVKVGDTVSQGQTLLLIEAMKTYNDLRAPRAGKVLRILVADTTPVEYGEALLILE